jgi:hypothetical protein
MFRLRASPISDCNKETDYQPNCRGNDASPSRPPNLNRNFIARKILNQRSSCVQIWKEVPSMQKIGNHCRLDLARTDTLHSIGAGPDTMEKAEDAWNDRRFNRDCESLESGESPKSGKQEKFLRLQDLRKSRNFWAAKFWTTRIFHLKAENQPYKQSSTINMRNRRISQPRPRIYP